jgi:hypothetical protein
MIGNFGRLTNIVQKLHGQSPNMESQNMPNILKQSSMSWLPDKYYTLHTSKQSMSLAT